MDEANMKEFEKVFQEKLEDAYMRGLAAGCKVISKAVLNKLNQHQHNMSAALREVRRFCSTNIISPVLPQADNQADKSEEDKNE